MTLLNFRQPLIFIDLEMSGPDPVEHQITEIAALKCDPKNFGEVSRFQSYCGAALGRTPEAVFKDAHPVAVSKTGLTVDRLTLARNPNEVIKDFRAWLPKEYIFVGYNLMLDFMFLRRSCSPEPRFKYRFLDITTLLEVYFAMDSSYPLGRSLSLEGAAKIFDIPCNNLHSALSDVLVSRRLFKSLMVAILTD